MLTIATNTSQHDCHPLLDVVSAPLPRSNLSISYLCRYGSVACVYVVVRPVVLSKVVLEWDSLPRSAVQSTLAHHRLNALRRLSVRMLRSDSDEALERATLHSLAPKWRTPCNRLRWKCFMRRILKQKHIEVPIETLVKHVNATKINVNPPLRRHSILSSSRGTAWNEIVFYIL